MAAKLLETAVLFFGAAFLLGLFGDLVENKRVMAVAKVSLFLSFALGLVAGLANIWLS